MKTTNEIFYLGSELPVRRIGLGTMRLTCGNGKWGEPKDKESATNVLRKAVEIGVNLIDTADMYGPEISEKIISKSLHPYPKEVIIATKGGNRIFGPGVVKPNCQPAYLRKAVEGSLKRLKVERIDLYQLHTVDPEIDIEFSVEELARIKQEGKIRFIGLSNIDLSNLKRALAVSEIHAVQNRFNINDQSSEEIISFTDLLKIAFISYYPLAKGLLANRLFGEHITDKPLLSNAQYSLLWQLKKYSNIIPIPGTTSVDHLIENFQTLTYLKNETPTIN